MNLTPGRKKEIEGAIREISERMTGPLSNIERGFLHADRKDLREELRGMSAEHAEPRKTA